jgi:hypothetical protein
MTLAGLDINTDILFNAVAQSTEPSDPVENDIYLDDGSNTASGNPGFRQYISAVWVDLGDSGGSSAPADAKYLLQQADGDLPNAQAMGALATGIVKNTTTTGVQSIAAAGTDYTSPTGTENLSNKTMTASSLIATALSLLLGGFRAIFTHSNSADRTYTFPNYDGTVATVAGTETFTNKTLTSARANQINDTNGNEAVIFTATASAVNEFTVANAATGTAPIISATGGNTDISIEIKPKGAGSVGIGTNTPSVKTAFDVVSTTQASRPFPTMNSTQRDAITSPATAGIIYNSTTARFEYYNGAAWVALGSGDTFLSPSPQFFLNTAGCTAIAGTWTNAANTAEILNQLYSNLTTNAQNDEFEFKIPLAAGTYTLNLVSVRDGTSGILTVRVDGSTVGTIDLYNAGSQVNVVSSIASIVVAATATKTINFKLETKNASSTDYIAYLTFVQFIKTA